MTDLDLIKFFMSRKAIDSNFNNVILTEYDATTQAMLKWCKHYFSKFKDDTYVNLERLGTLMNLKVVPKDQEDAQANLRLLLKRMGEPLDMVVKSVILEQLETRRLKADLEMLIHRYDQGEEIDLAFDSMTLTQESYKRRKIKHQGAWCDGDVWEMFKKDMDNSGYFFTFLPSDIWENIKGVNEGDNIVVAAPTDKGKTSFLVNVAICFAKQRKALYEQYLAAVKDGSYEGEDEMEFRPIVYLVNEGMSERITPRVYQTALNVNQEGMKKLGEAGKLESEYVRVMGRRDCIRLIDIHGMSVADVAKVIEAHNPFMVITDMTGRIKAHGSSGANDTPQLEEVWNDMRTLAALHRFIHVGTVQISAEGMDNFYPPLTAIQNSKVGIQSTWDLAFYIGAMMQPPADQANHRGISTPKNKKPRQGKPSDNRSITWFDPEHNTWILPDA